MWEWAAAAAASLWLGLQTSMGPCSLATNIAAVSFLGRRIGKTRVVLASGLLYAVGRALGYAAVAAALVLTGLSMSRVSLVLQQFMHILLGPIMVLAGLFLCGWIAVPIKSTPVPPRWQETIAAWGLWGAVPLGMLFAVSFCPTSAVLFFGSLLPLAFAVKSPLVLPMLYGIGTAIPAIACAVVIALSVQRAQPTFQWLTQAERRMRYITGFVFVAVGLFVFAFTCLSL